MAPGKTYGVIRRLCDEKPGRPGGFGFIRTQDGQDFFFHNTELLNVTFAKLAVGDEMEFVPTETPKGLRANEVERIKAFQP